MVECTRQQDAAFADEDVQVRARSAGSPPTRANPSPARYRGTQALVWVAKGLADMLREQEVEALYAAFLATDHAPAPPAPVAAAAAKERSPGWRSGSTAFAPATRGAACAANAVAPSGSDASAVVAAVPAVPSSAHEGELLRDLSAASQSVHSEPVPPAPASARDYTHTSAAAAAAATDTAALTRGGSMRLPGERWAGSGVLTGVANALAKLSPSPPRAAARHRRMSYAPPDALQMRAALARRGASVGTPVFPAHRASVMLSGSDRRRMQSLVRQYTGVDAEDAEDVVSRASALPSSAGSTLPRTPDAQAAALAPTLVPVAVSEEEALAAVGSAQDWGFDPFAFSDAVLGRACVLLARDTLALLPALGVAEATMHAYCTRVARGYRAVPYHNFKHGVSVMQVCVKQLQTQARRATVAVRLRPRTLSHVPPCTVGGIAGRDGQAGARACSAGARHGAPRGEQRL